MTDYDTQILALGPDAYWKLDEASGLVFADSSPHGNALTAGAGAVENYRIPGPSPTQIPYAIDFLNVSPPHAAIGSLGAYAVAASFTVECWFGSVGTISTNVAIVTKGYNSIEQRPWYSLGMQSGGVPFWWFRDAAGTDYKLTGYGNLSDASYTSRGPFHHLVGTFTPGTADLYVDGVHQARLSVPNTGWGTGSQPITLGVLSTTVWGGPWVADVALYPGQLSAAQVLSNFNLGHQDNPQYLYQLYETLSGMSADLSLILASVRKTYTAP